ncbi:MAG: hypothetical protein FJZ01_11915 [Candidatus Sericytochromatia bacterium]|nr:hypothetical protein [Candidatus Tanganyikabacteria bacterium]
MLTLAAAIILLAAPVPVPPGWAIVGDEAKGYFVADPGNVVRRELIDSRNTGTQTDRRGETSADKDELASTDRSEIIKTETFVVNPTDRRLEGRLLKTYEVKQIDKVSYLTTKRLFKVYTVTDYEKRVRTQYLNTYAVTTQYTWTDPYTGETVTHKVRVVEAPKAEEIAGDWEAAQDRKYLREYWTSETARTVIKSDTQDRLLATVAAPPDIDGDAVGASKARDLTILSGEAGKGVKSASNATAGKSFSLSGAPRAQSGGGVRVATAEDLYALAAKAPNLVDEAGNTAWKLTTGKGLLLFTPYDSAGALRAESVVRVDATLKPATAPGGAQIRIASFSAGAGGSALLTGSFRNPFLGGGKGSAYLAAR